MSVAGDSVTGPGVFSRPASGLIRVAGSFDVFVFNVGLVSIGIAVALNQYYGPSLYPGVAVWLSTLLATVGMAFVAATFYGWAVTFPRSGGVYVSLSRAAGPGLGFVFSLVETLILMYYAALAASLIVTVGLSSFLSTIGFLSTNQTMIDWAASLSSAGGIFWVGAVILLVAGVLLTSGTRRYFSVQRVLFVVAAVGTLVLIAVMAFGSRSAFQANLTRRTGLDYQGVIDAARSGGWASSSFSFSTSFKFLVWPLLPLLGAVQSVGIGGEIKSVRRSQLVGMLGAVIGTGLIIALFDVLANKSFGAQFQGAIAFNSLTGATTASTEATVGAAPWFTVLAGILANNAFLAVVILATFVTWIWFWIPAEIAYTTRTMIAWSFDRIAPDGLGYVSERFHTPVVAIWLSTVGSIVFMWFIAFKAIALLTLIEALTIVWGAAMAASIWFPRTRGQLFRMSPASEQRIGKAPLMSVTGAVSTLFLLAVLIMLWRDPNAAGPLFTSGGPRGEFWLLLAAVVVGIIWYVGVKAYRKRRGIDISLAFRQIPIE